MNMKNVIAKMSEGGYTVDIVHLRLWNEFGYGSSAKPIELTVGQAYDVGCPIVNLLPRGGRTIVRIHDAFGTFEGIAKCSNKDPYNKKEGIRIAFKRAKENLKILREDKRARERGSATERAIELLLAWN